MNVRGQRTREPILDSGKVGRFGPENRWATGVTVVDGYAYTGMDNKLVRYKIADGAGATAEAIAGGGGSGCADANAYAGDQARFYNVNVIGNDGHLIFVTDPSCGLREVNPETGSTRTISAPVSTRSAIVRNYVYSADSNGRIWRYDLQSGQPTRMFDDVVMYGALAADDNYLWGFNADGKLYRLSLHGSANPTTFSIPATTALTALSVGDFVYFVDAQYLLRRISKTDGSLQIVAGDGAHRDELLYNTMAIASDGTNLYTAGERGLYVITPSTREYLDPVAPGAGPDLEPGSMQKSVTSFAGNRSGVTVIGWYAFTASGTTVSRTNIYTGETIVLAGGSAGCSDASTGEQATFYDASVIGNDGSLVYVFDSSCGLRAVNPYTGSTRSLRAPANQRSSIGGKYLYTIDAANTLNQYGLESGVTNTVMRNLPSGALMATSGSVVWVVSDRTLTSVMVEDTKGKQVERYVGALGTIKENLTYRVVGSSMTYADSALYVMTETRTSGDSQSTPATVVQQSARIDVDDATMKVFGNPLSGTAVGFSVTKKDVFVLAQESGSTSLVRIHDGSETDPTFQEDLSYYIDEDTKFIPVTHGEDAFYFRGTQLLWWDPETGRCTAGCQGIKVLAKELASRPIDSKWDDFKCSVGFGTCNAEDYEKAIVLNRVDDQQIYDHDGDLREDRKEYVAKVDCEQMASSPDYCDDPDTLKKIVSDAETIYDIGQSVWDFLKKRGGLRETSCVNSFRAGTQVLMADGTSTAIEDIRPGQQVLAGDPMSHAAVAEPVTMVHVNTDTELTDITLADGSEIHTTAHHPFWTPEQESWTDAQDLAAGAILSSVRGTATVNSVINSTGSMTIYNLTVARMHTYYVMAGDRPILVHNSDCDAFGEVADELPVRPNDTGPTSGQVVESVDGKVQKVGDVIKSGTYDPELNDFLWNSPDVPNPGTRPSNGNPAVHFAADHVETKVAWAMRKRGITDAKLVINNRRGLCEPAFGCENAVPAVLPRGSTLTVYWRDVSGVMRSVKLEGIGPK
ncbi:DddA-like double-stranded DNA deaminase toxin [Actinoplanes sp. HUAS TT8]|uniref:DddA-like double-stranded DNA deaminase toxin n=1 Tax=Actinoplanes sp. HUAS TT8 TaxID=3447453 RepID=UPI003F51FCF3